MDLTIIPRGVMLSGVKKETNKKKQKMDIYGKFQLVSPEKKL